MESTSIGINGSTTFHVTSNRREESDKDKKLEVLYICDKKACATGCSYDLCFHTTDIRHAKNFKALGDVGYIEQIDGHMEPFEYLMEFATNADINISEAQKHIAEQSGFNTRKIIFDDSISATIREGENNVDV